MTVITPHYLQILGIMAEELGLEPDAIEPADQLGDGLGADSLDRIELMMRFEEEFGIAIADEEAVACGTVAEVVALLDRKIAEKGVVVARVDVQ